MSTRRAMFYSFVDRYSGLVLSVIASMVIARLLKPEEIGVFSVTLALLGFAATLRDMGAGQYVVQAKDVTDDVVRAVWTIQFGVGAVLGLAVLAFAYPMAAFYNEPRMTPIMGVMALTYFTTPVGSITYALLMRDMRFQHVAVMRFSSGLVGAVVSVGLAYEGFGPISLAWGLLAASLTTALASQFFRRPGQPWGFSLLGAREVLGFGSRITGTSFINTLVQGMPDFALGKLQGMTAAGLYSRSNGLVAMFNRLLLDSVYGVAIAHFSKSKRENKDPTSDFMKTLSSLVTINVVFTLTLCALAEPITRVLYGDQWGESVELTRWLAFGTLVMATQPACLALTLGHGRSELVLKASMVTALGHLIAVLVGAYTDLRTLGIALVIGNAWSAAVWIRTVRQVCSFSLQLFATTWLKAVTTGLVACLPLPFLILVFGFEPQQPLLCVALAGAVSLFALLFSLRLTGHPLEEDMRAFYRRMPWVRTNSRNRTAA